MKSVGYAVVSFIVCALALLPHAVCARADAAKTAAPPKAMESIYSVLDAAARGRQCTRMGTPEVLSSSASNDAKFDAGRLTAGSITEVWQVRMCDRRMRYSFTIEPNASGELIVSGFEPVK